MLPSTGKVCPRVTARLRPRNIDIRCCDWSQPGRHETRDFVTASVCVPDRHRRATGRRSDVNTHLVSDKGCWIGGLGMAQVTGEGKNAVLRWHGVMVWLKVTVCCCGCSVYKLGAQILVRGCIQKPQRNAPSRGISAKSPGPEGKRKIIRPLWCHCSSTKMAIVKLLVSLLIGLDSALLAHASG